MGWIRLKNQVTVDRIDGNATLRQLSDACLIFGLAPSIHVVSFYKINQRCPFLREAWTRKARRERMGDV